MKIAIVCENDRVSSHFGKSNKIVCFNENGIIIETINVEKHEHEGIFHLLMEAHVDEVICMQLGHKVVDRLKEHKIKVISGVNGQIDEVIQRYINKTIVSKDNICQHHHEHDEK